MKRLIILTITAISILGCNAQSLSDILGSLGKGKGEGSDISNTISGMLQDLTSSKDFKISDIAGTWAYSAPAVSFKGDNALKNIGGSAAATALETKLKPYYDRIGFSNMTITINADSTFSMAMKKVSLPGTISKDEDGLIFTFDRAKKHPVRCMATKSGKKLCLTFDASKLISALQTASKYINISTLKTISSLLSNYDGLYIGFELTNSGTPAKK